MAYVISNPNEPETIGKVGENFGLTSLQTFWAVINNKLSSIFEDKGGDTSNRPYFALFGFSITHWSPVRFASENF